MTLTTFNPDGHYNKTDWQYKQLITEAELDKIEDAIWHNREDILSHKKSIDTILGIIDKPPTYIKPTFSISLNKTTVQHNQNVNIIITPNFTKNDAGNIVKYTLKKGTDVLYDDTSLSNYNETINIPHGDSITYTATVEYADGVIKDTLLGIPYPDTSIKSGTINASNTVKSYALSYYGVIDTNTLTIGDISNLLSNLKTSKGHTTTYNMVNQHSVYMYPKSFGTLSSIKDANNFEYINSYTRTEMTYDDVDYYVYVLTDPVTITGFKQVFS